MAIDQAGRLHQIPFPLLIIAQNFARWPAQRQPVRRHFLHQNGGGLGRFEVVSIFFPNKKPLLRNRIQKCSDVDQPHALGKFQRRAFVAERPRGPVRHCCADGKPAIAVGPRGVIRDKLLAHLMHLRRPPVARLRRPGWKRFRRENIARRAPRFQVGRFDNGKFALTAG